MQKNISAKGRLDLNDEWYRELYEFSPLMYFIIDSDGHVISVNKKGAEVLGYKDDELIGQQVLDVFYPDDKKLVLKQLKKCLQEPEKVHNWEFRKVRKDGCMLWVKESARVISEDGRILIFIICEDISAQKKAEEDLREKLFELAKKNRYEKIISAVTRSVHSSINIDDVFDNAVQAIHENINNADIVGIFLVEGQNAVVKAHRGYPDRFLKKIKKIPYPKGFTWKTILDGKPLYCSDVEKDTVIGPTGKKVGTKSYASMPIKYKRKTIGCISINSNEKNAFNKKELNLFKIVTQQIEVAIQNAKQAEALRKSEETLQEKLGELSKKNKYEEIISAVTRSVHQSINHEEVFENAVEAMSNNIDKANIVEIYLIEDQRAVLKSQIGYKKTYIKQAGSIPYPKGFIWKTAIDKKPIYCPDTEKDTIIGPAGREAGIKTYLSMPIRFEGKVFGVIGINSFQKQAFDEEELKLLEVVAKQIETAINNAQHAEALKKSEEAQRKSEEHFRHLVETTNVIPWEADIQTQQFTYVGPQAQGLLGYPVEQWYEQDFWPSHMHPDDREKTIEKCLESTVKKKDYELEYRMISSDGNIVWLHDLVSIITEDEEPKAIRGSMIDITERKQTDSLLLSEKHVLEMISQGKPLPELLELICITVEKQTNRMLCSFCLVDDTGKALVSCAAPNMSQDYAKDIGRLPIGPGIASCGTAAYTKKQVIASDTSTDPLWTDFQDLALNHNLQACWSTPILSSSGELHGTFAMYYSEPKEPIQWELDIIERATNLARIAIERKKAEDTLKENLDILSRKNRYEEIISTVTRSVHSSINFQDVLENAVESFSKNMGIAQHVSILMIEGDEAVLKASRGLPKWFIQRLGKIPYPEGFVWKVLTEGKPRYCPDVDLDKYIGPTGREIGTKSYLSVPFNYKGNTIGCINLHSFEKNAFSDDEINLVEIVAQQIEVAINNARQAEALGESEERYRTLYDQSPLGVFIFNMDMVITSFNKRLSEILKSSPEGINGLELKKLKDQKFTYLYERALQGHPAQHENFYITSSSNIELCLSVSASPLRDADDNILGGMAVVEDVTKRRKMEERLGKSQKLESLGILAGGIAHDFNNLLTSIMGNLSIARTYPNIDEQLLELFREAEEATGRASDLVSQLLTFSKGGAPVKRLVSNFDDFITDIANFTVSGSKARCDFNIQEGLWNLEIDEAQFSQVIENLVINAQQAMPRGGTIKISIKNTQIKKTNKLYLLHGKHIKITIEDNGTGISPDNLDKVFDPYFTTKEEGHGLGLSSVYSIVNNHQGHIDVQSKPGVGTTFHIYLPASDEIVKSISRPEKKITKGKGRILFMDDEALIKKAAGRMLKKMGYEVEYASDGVEAVEKYKEAKDSDPFDLVIMDLTIPGGMGGTEAIKILKSIDPDIKAVVSSGYSNDPVLSDYKKFGFKDIVKKPYRLEVLSDTIENALNS